jgi:glycosyltransferase involved in cell wall biosynthesis
LTFDFIIVTHVIHGKLQGGYFAYGPYVKEMNLWLKGFKKVLIIAPVDVKKNVPNPIDIYYTNNNITVINIPEIKFTNFFSAVISIFQVFYIDLVLIYGFILSRHIHLRCPGNIGLLGCIIQIFFPFKRKTAKYAGNWDPESKQPLSYKVQRWVLNNTSITKNIRVLVYGNWKDNSKNVLPFFTASYTSNLIDTDNQVKQIDNCTIKCLFVGTLSKGKNPMISVNVVEQLRKDGFEIRLDMYGEGSEYINIRNYISQNKLEEIIQLHGNVTEHELIGVYKNSHFLIFASDSEGWPKVVAESMFWGCLPITTNVSCVGEMIGYGERGVLVRKDVNEILEHLKTLIQTPDRYIEKVKKAKEWSRTYTLESFEGEIQKLLH